MGCSPFYKSCSVYPAQTPGAPNPDPARFKILRVQEFPGYITVAKVHYPDARNYEGVKIMVYRGVTIEQLQQAERLDPHFSPDPTELSPTARFEPTEEGWLSACRYAMMIC